MALHLYIPVAVAMLMFIPNVLSYSSGAAACTYPSHGVDSSAGNGGFSISIPNNVNNAYVPGNTYNITITRSTANYLGFLLQVVQGDPGSPDVNTKGSFRPPSDQEYQLKYCGGNPNGAVTHTMWRHGNPTNTDSFLWEAPVAGTGTVTIRLVGVVGYTQWYGQQSAITMKLTEGSATAPEAPAASGTSSGTSSGTPGTPSGASSGTSSVPTPSASDSSVSAAPMPQVSPVPPSQYANAPAGNNSFTICLTIDANTTQIEDNDEAFLADFKELFPNAGVSYVTVLNSTTAKFTPLVAYVWLRITKTSLTQTEAISLVQTAITNGEANFGGFQTTSVTGTIVPPGAPMAPSSPSAPPLKDSPSGASAIVPYVSVFFLAVLAVVPLLV